MADISKFFCRFWRRAIALAVVLAVVFAAGYEVLAQPADQPRPAVPPAVPVSVAKAVRQDVPVWLRALGTAQAYNGVTIRARVDGTLMKITVTEGQEVKQGALIAVIDPRPYQAALDAAKAKEQQDEAQLANARADLARYSSLAQQSFASRQQVDTQQAQVKQMTAAIAGDEAQVESAELNLSFCYIVSPIDGRIGLRMVDPGNMVRASDTSGIISVTQIRPISVTFTLPQEDLPRVSAQMAAAGHLQVVAFSQDDQTELDKGELLTPDNAIDQSTGTIKMKATFQNSKNLLWPGQFVNARLLLKTEADVLAVPSAAVQHGPGGLYAYVVKPDSTVSRQPVRVEREEGDLSVIASGLTEGQEVVTNGQSRLQEGTRVAATQSDNAAAVNTKTGG